MNPLALIIDPAGTQSSVSPIRPEPISLTPDFSPVPSPEPPPQTVSTVSLEYALLTRMFDGDLELAANFVRIGHFDAALQHLKSAREKLSQLAALPRS